jgi:hypothetical protein
MPEFDVVRGARPGRSPAPARARPMPPALRLQSVIGNRATARLLRQATETEERAYFLNDGALRETLRARFKLTLHQMVLEIQAEKFCTRL